jgi:hypothetical protein
MPVTPIGFPACAGCARRFGMNRRRPFRRLARRFGRSNEKAAVAVAHTLARIAWTVIRHGHSCAEAGEDHCHQRDCRATTIWPATTGRPSPGWATRSPSSHPVTAARYQPKPPDHNQLTDKPEMPVAPALPRASCGTPGFVTGSLSCWSSRLGPGPAGMSTRAGATFRVIASIAFRFRSASSRRHGHLMTLDRLRRLCAYVAAAMLNRHDA